MRMSKEADFAFNLGRDEQVVGAECRFCSNTRRVCLRSPWDTVLLETSNFRVVPTLGALVEGWVLIIPKHHVICLGALNKDLIGELREVVGSVNYAFERASLGYPTLFEHGPVTPRSPFGCGVDHAHLHMVPLKFSLLQDAEVADLDWKFCEVEDLADIFLCGKEYLYLSEPGLPSVVATPNLVQSQFFRRVIARQVNTPEQFDYKKYSQVPHVKATIGRLSPHL